MNRYKDFLLGAIVGIGLTFLYGFQQSGEVGRFAPTPMGLPGGGAGLFITDTKTGVTKVVWGAWKGGQLGQPFASMGPSPIQ